MLKYKIFTHKKTLMDKEIRRNRILRGELDYNLGVLKDTLSKLSRKKVKVPLEVSLLISELTREISKMNSPGGSVINEFLNNKDNMDAITKHLDTLLDTLNEENKVISLLNQEINDLVVTLYNSKYY